MFWRKGIPSEIQYEINQINNFTRKTGREASITACQKPGRDSLFVSSSAKGDTSGTEALPCDYRFGDSARIADVHTHPTDSDTIGILPSQSDFYSTLVDSHVAKRAQISCVTSPKTPLTECYQPKALPDQTKLRNYERALDRAQIGEPGYYIDNVQKDFEISFFNPKNGQKINKPHPHQVVDAAFGESRKDLQKKLGEFEHGGFCEYVVSFTVPKSRAVYDTCKAELRRRNLFGIIEY